MRLGCDDADEVKFLSKDNVFLNTVGNGVSF
jgi:hypothetical protein